MNKVFIKHNPYKLSTDIKVDGEDPKKDRKLNFEDRRLQEWFYELPRMLKDDYSSKKFQITFHGTKLDFEDMKELIPLAKKQHINFELEHIKGQEIEDKQEKIEKLFQEIQSGPIDELKSSKIKDAFKSAKNKDFKVNVIATMSSGKSTLINALLGNKLMPSKNQACTAIITEIKDTDEKIFSAKVYNKNGQEIDRCNSLTYETMQKINSNERVSKVCIEGDIPFVNSEDISLVLVDTPGTNNSRDEAHREVTYNLLKENHEDLVLYVMNATQSGIKDDEQLLKYIGNIMKTNGKQSRDRFIFVLNKLDAFDEEDDKVTELLIETKEYLEDTLGIENPNIYPISASTALNIRSIENIKKEHELLKFRAVTIKFNEEEQLHLEKYAPLPKFIKQGIEERLKRAKERGDKMEEALIHTGIISLEEAIKFYLRTKTIDFILVD